MLAQPHFGFAKGPVLVTHQAENGQQLWLRELVLAETASVTREHRPGDLQAMRAKGSSPTSAIAPPVSIENRQAAHRPFDPQ